MRLLTSQLAFGLAALLIATQTRAAEPMKAATPAAPIVVPVISPTSPSVAPVAPVAPLAPVVPTVAATASPTATPSPSPTAAPSASPSATPTATPAKKAEDDSSSSEIKKHCARHYPGQIQGELRTACSSAADEFKSSEKNLASTRCRLAYGEEPRLVMPCLIGVSIIDDLKNSKEDFKRKLQVCAEQYPQHTEIDAFLQESCLTGVHLNETMASTDGPSFEICGKLSPERSFIGPCAVGLSLARESLSSSEPGQQNKLCEQYFDHRRFHLTYRACLNARAVPIEGDVKIEDQIASCSNITANPDNDNERAACVIGASIHRSISKKTDIAKKFTKCGGSKVSYQERDFLACLTAASLVELQSDRGRVDAGCKAIFRQAKGSSRGSCVSSISLF